MKWKSIRSLTNFYLQYIGGKISFEDLNQQAHMFLKHHKMKFELDDSVESLKGKIQIIFPDGNRIPLQGYLNKYVKSEIQAVEVILDHLIVMLGQDGCKKEMMRLLNDKFREKSKPHS